jgi:hypothetical protein
MKTGQMAQPLAKDQVPFFIPLANEYKLWVPDVVEIERQREIYLNARSDHEKMKIIPVKKKDRIPDWQKHRNFHRDNLKNLLVHAMTTSRNRSDPFQHFDAEKIKVVSLADDALFQEAVEAVPDTGEITQAEKTKQLKTLEKKMADAKRKIKEHSPEGYFMLDNGEIRGDARFEFVTFWREQQAWIQAPCNPLKIDLEFSSEVEKWAWKELEIGASINPKAEKWPFNPER